MNRTAANGGGHDPFFFYAGLPAEPGPVTLAGDEGRHALSARRLRVGDAVTLFDGRGGTGHGRVVGVDARRKTLEIDVGALSSVPPPRPVALAAALPKGERLAVMLDMATQLGMTRFIPLDCVRSVVKASDSARKRWARICLEACKQSRRAWLPELGDAVTPAGLFDGWGGQAAVWIAQPGGVPFDRALQTAPRPTVVMVGPEGGFTGHELEAARDRGAHPVSLGDALLRIETAAAACLAAIALSPPPAEARGEGRA